MDKDVRVTVKVQNALILRRMEAKGIYTVTELAKQVGINQSSLSRFVSMKDPARKTKGNYILDSLAIFH